MGKYLPLLFNSELITGITDRNAAVKNVQIPVFFLFCPGAHVHVACHPAVTASHSSVNTNTGDNGRGRAERREEELSDSWRQNVREICNRAIFSTTTDQGKCTNNNNNRALNQS